MTMGILSFILTMGKFFFVYQTATAENEDAVTELSDKTNQMVLEESSQASTESQEDKQPKRRGKRTKKGYILICVERVDGEIFV